MIDDTEFIILKKLTIKKLVIWCSAAVAIFVLFYWGIPVNIYQNSPVFFAAVGSISLTVTVIMSMALLMSLKKPKPDPNAGSIEGYVIFAVLMVTLFGGGALFIYREIQMEKQELAQYGEVAIANIVNGSSLTTRRVDLTNITLTFVKKDGEESTVTHSISSKQFANFYQGQQVPVLYSTRYPSVIKIIDSFEEMQKYIKPGSRGQL